MLPPLLGDDRFRVFSVVAESPDGERHEARLTSYRVPRGRRGDELQAADAEDARVLPRRPARLRGRRHAEQARVRPGLLRQERRRGRRREADRAPLQDPGVRRSPRHLGVPEEIRSRPPTTDTYSLPQSQEEFYFSVPYEKMDLCLYALNNGFLRPRSRTPWACRSMRSSASSATSRRSGARRPTSRCRRGSSNLCRRSRLAEPKVQSSRRPVRARPRVTSSAYSRSEPTGRPLASLVTRTLARRRSAM